MLSSPIKNQILLSLFLAFYSFNLFSSNVSSCLVQQLETTANLVPTYASPAGNFANESKEVTDQIKLHFQAFKKSSQKTYAENDILPFQKKDVSLDLNIQDAHSIIKLAAIARENASKLHYITSAAGQWSRGRIKVVKALVPYNLKEIIGPNLASRIRSLDKLLASSETSEIIAMAKKLKLSNITDIDFIKKEAQTWLTKIIKNASADFEKGLNPLDLKFMNVALLSKKTSSYVPFDIITAPHTHQEISNYLTKLKSSFQFKIFHKDPVQNKKIIEALAEYFQKSDKLHDTHILGHQRGVLAIDPTTGDFLPGSAPSSIGAGNFMADLKNSGRMNVHKREIYHFDNIEVVSNLEETLAMHVIGKAETSITVVPTKAGYKGGSPYLIKNENGTMSTQLVEDFLVPDYIKKQGELFNTGSITVNQNAKPPRALSFENKVDKDTGKPIVRVKSTPGDFTQENTTSVILGRLDDDPTKRRDYENFKSWDDYLNNGSFYLETIVNNL